MANDSEAIKSTPKRIAFIDLARSIAIVLMLEGHITGELLSTQFRQENSALYQLWRQVHGYTSPLFFTISGVVFVYLLTMPLEGVSFWNHPRVKKGLKRVLELLVWGYVLQFHFKNFILCQWDGASYNTDWLMAFHVLQSIGVSLFLVIAIFGLSKLTRIPFFILGFAAAVFMFGCNGILETYIREQKMLLSQGVISNLNYWPVGTSRFFQNMFFGQYSEFSFVRFSGYTLLGGAIGHFIRLYQNHVVSLIFGSTLFGIGYVLKRDVYFLLEGIDQYLMDWGWQNVPHQMANKDALIGLSMVLCLLGLLVILNRFVVLKPNLLMKMGQNTFPIYIIHVMIIYEGLLGFGLPLEHYKEFLSPVQSWMISFSIIALFFVMIHYWERLEAFGQSQTMVLLNTFSKEK
jgi:uncharacterized membrane protein